MKTNQNVQDITLMNTNVTSAYLYKYDFLLNLLLHPHAKVLKSVVKKG